MSPVLQVNRKKKRLESINEGNTESVLNPRFLIPIQGPLNSTMLPPYNKTSTKEAEKLGSEHSIYTRLLA